MPKAIAVERTLVWTPRAGTHVRTWDGRDDAGRSVTSGTYLYRLESGGESRSRKMLLMR